MVTAHGNFMSYSNKLRLPRKNTQNSYHKEATICVCTVFLKKKLSGEKNEYLENKRFVQINSELLDNHLPWSELHHRITTLHTKHRYITIKKQRQDSRV
jgi:hypothetical protein